MLSSYKKKRNIFFIIILFFQVKWFKDTMVLDPTNVRLMTKYGDRYVLTLPISKPSDFGNYSCLAENSLGKHRGIVEVSGLNKKSDVNFVK